MFGGGGGAGMVVAPHAGAWIETMRTLRRKQSNLVAPHAGAWIETANHAVQLVPVLVAPHAGAWIETLLIASLGMYLLGRSPRGSVD